MVRDRESGRGVAISSDESAKQEPPRGGLRALLTPEGLLAYLRAHFHSLASIWVRGLSVLFGFAITFFIGRNFGPLANGQYALVTQTALFLSILAVGGMDQAIVRRFSAAFVHNLPMARATMLRALWYSLGAAIIIVAVLAIGGTPLFGALFGEHLPQHALVLTSLILVARTMTRVTAAVLRSQNVHITGQIIEVLIIPMSVCVLLFAGLLGSINAVLWATAGIGLAAALYGIARSLDYSRSTGETIDVPMRDMFRTSLPLWLTAISLNITDWYGLATAANMLGVYDAGLFRVAYQIGGALSFVAMGMYTVFAARISAALVAGDRESVARLARAVTRLAMLILLPVVALLLIFARELLTFIGPEFASATPILQIVLVGQALYVATGPAGLVLAMSGHEKLNFLISASVTAALVITAPLVTQHYGLVGLATAMATVLVLGNIANVVMVYRRVRINVLTGTCRDAEGAEPA